VSTPANAPAERYQLFQRAGSTRWQVRFSIKGQGKFKRSLDTDDEREAERRAEAIWYEATYRAKQGLTAKTHTFGSVAESYIAQILREVERGERRADQGKSEPAVIRRYFVSCFGDKPVDAVTEADLERYAEWRRTYWTEGPGKLITHIEYERDGHRLRRPVRRSAPSLSRQRGETVVPAWAASLGLTAGLPEEPTGDQHQGASVARQPAAELRAARVRSTGGGEPQLARGPRHGWHRR
jgi:hypothetical protein